MYKVLYHKFTQHSYLRQQLLGTQDRRLVEHSPYDSYWGDGGDGKGLNKLGELLMKLRDALTGHPPATQLKMEEPPNIQNQGSNLGKKIQLDYSGYEHKHVSDHPSARQDNSKCENETESGSSVDELLGSGGTDGLQKPITPRSSNNLDSQTSLSTSTYPTTPLPSPPPPSFSSVVEKVIEKEEGEKKEEKRDEERNEKGEREEKERREEDKEREEEKEEEEEEEERKEDEEKHDEPQTKQGSNTNESEPRTSSMQENKTEHKPNSDSNQQYNSASTDDDSNSVTEEPMDTDEMNNDNSDSGDKMDTN